MNDFSSKQIQDKFVTLPKALQEALSSPEIMDRIGMIGQSFGLHVDQIGDLMDQVGLVMMGLARSSDFVKQTSSRLSLDPKITAQIADQINKDVFSRIKTHLREVEERAEAGQTVSSIEQAGGFSVETDNDQGNGSQVTSADKGKIISSIENPLPGKETSVPRMAPAAEDIKAEPLVDQLLAAPTARPEVKVSRGPDPYREPPK